MAEGETALLTIRVNDEGFYHASYILRPDTRLKKLFKTYRRCLCVACTDASLLEFWYESTQLKDAHTPEILGLADGDTIDVRIPNQHTRGACPVPPQHTLPNIHYPANDEREDEEAATPTTRAPAKDDILRTAADEPPASAMKRVKLTLKDQNNFSIDVSVKLTTRLGKVIEEFVRRTGRESRLCKFFYDGTRVLPNHTPEELEMEDENVVEMHMTLMGGGNRYGY